MNKLFFAFLATAGFLLSACSSTQKDYSYMAQKDYQTRPKLSESLLGPNNVLSEDSIRKILNSKVTLPNKINLAVVRLSDYADGLEFQTIEKELADKFYNKSNWGSRVRTVIPVPQVMLAKPVTLNSLRQAAALLQADAIVIIKPVSYSDWKYQWFEQNKAKGITSLEVLFLDTRTSVVPYTSLITETSEILKASDDYSDYELMTRAKKASETKALLQVAPSIEKFIATAM